MRSDASDCTESSGDVASGGATTRTGLLAILGVNGNDVAEEVERGRLRMSESVDAMCGSGIGDVGIESVLDAL